MQPLNSNDRRGKCDFCGAPAVVRYNVPDILMGAGVRSVEGWEACAACDAFVQATDPEGLRRRLYEMFPKSAASRRTIDMLQASFWTVQALRSYTRPQKPIDKTAGEHRCNFCAEPTIEIHKFRMREEGSYYMMDACPACASYILAADKDGLLQRSIDILIDMPEDEEDGEYVSKARRVVQRAMNEVQDAFWIRYVPEKVDLPWVAAMKNHHAAINLLTAARNYGDARMRNSTLRDLAMMRIAETYSFSGYAKDVIHEAAQSVPTDVSLTPENVRGNGFGFWWFTPAQPWRLTAALGRGTSGLLWGIQSPLIKDQALVIPAGSPVGVLEAILEGRPELMSVYFSAYVNVPDGKTGGTRPIPSTSFNWHIGESIDEMLERCRQDYKQAYPNSKPGDTDPDDPLGVPLMGVEHHIGVIKQMACFFLAATTWMEQEILETPEAHVDRAERRRIQKEHRLSEPPKVQVIALRKRAKSQDDNSEESVATGRTWKLTHAIVVRGHWRQQPYGPGREKRKLIRIMPHRKGPEPADGVEEPGFKPRVYSVVR